MCLGEYWDRRDEETGRWREMQNEVLPGLYASPGKILIVKPRRLVWAGQLARMGEMIYVYMFLVGEPKE